MKQKIAAHLFPLSFVVGAAYWLLSPVLFGRYEPWDYSLPLYWAVMSVAGLVLGLLGGRHSWVGIAGLYAGQCLILYVRPAPNQMETAPLHFVLLILAIHTSPAVLAASVGWLVKKAIDRRGRPNKTDPPDAASASPEV
ncbi:MAG: hypothetical protein HN742_27515 [Lentisphaerae bacterium]|jgi:hypothetical protein|nr:hypothetical protein [Lentisphaerota bacterium]MBT4819915.1 hypothetical protein [Lentisphaerota bacterium]MBT5607980.1 hypothetical protein [Lentisphaerota bacterium]MBT7057507.1 hypothetical protein [Lentisphaerota bacterium]MBT7845653.1 hypothetical protein [Lentisphaerota bacterium]